MKIIKKKNEIIYRASKNKKVKFKTDKKLYCEIVVDVKDKRIVEEVYDGNVR